MAGESILTELLEASAVESSVAYPEYGDSNYGDETGYTDVYGDDDT